MTHALIIIVKHLLDLNGTAVNVVKFLFFLFIPVYIINGKGKQYKKTQSEDLELGLAQLPELKADFQSVLRSLSALMFVSLTNNRGKLMLFVTNCLPYL